MSFAELTNNSIQINWTPPQGYYDLVNITAVLIATDAYNFYINSSSRKQCTVNKTYNLIGYKSDNTKIFIQNNLCPMSKFNIYAQAFRTGFDPGPIESYQPSTCKIKINIINKILFNIMG